MWQLQYRAAEFLEGVARLVIQADFHEHQQAAFQVLRVEPGVVAHDDALAFQAANALGARRGGKPNFLAQFGEGNTPVILQDPQNVAVDLVQFTLALVLGSHRGCPSVKGDFAENSRQI